MPDALNGYSVTNLIAVMTDAFTLGNTLRLRALLTALLLGLAVSPALAHGDATVGDDDRGDRLREARLQRQTVHLLTSSRVQAQEQALHLVIHYAHVDTLDARFYRPMTSHLASIATEGQTEGLQIMAVSALAKIDTPASMRLLEESAPRIESERVKRLADRAMTQHRLQKEAARLEHRARLVVWRDW